jgi:hypothetical protein
MCGTSLRVSRSNLRVFHESQAWLGAEKSLPVEKVRNGKSGRQWRSLSGALIALVAVVSLALAVGSASAEPGDHGNACPPASPNAGGDPPCGDLTEEAPAPEVVSDPGPPPSPPAHGAVKGTIAKSGPAPVHHAAPTVTVAPEPASPVVHHAKKHHKVVPKIAPLAPPILAPLPAPAPAGNPARSTLADRVLTPTELDLSAHNLGQGGVLALLLAALLYLPVMIFNKSTEKNHATIERWLSRPRAWWAAATGWLPTVGNPYAILAIGVVASTALFVFVEPNFPNEEGAWQYALGMLLGFAIVSTVFFATWRYVIHVLEPQSEGRWRIFPPYIVLAAFLVLMARLAHFLPGVVLGTVAEYEPKRKLNRRTAGIRVAWTYGALLVVGLIAWFAWIPVSHNADHEGASSLTLILDSMLAIIFVSSLESVCFGLIPMTFLDGNDLYVWKRPLWAAMWGAALVWFAIAIMHPALNTYSHISSRGAIFFGLLFALLMLVAVSTWGYFRVREIRWARAEKSATTL